MLLQTLKTYIQFAEPKELQERLGYSSSKIFTKTIDKFMHTNSSYEWLYNGHYDLVFSSKDFIVALCNAFDVDKNLLNEELKNARKYHDEVEKFKYSYIYIYTHFRRTSEPIFVLALLEQKRRISLYGDSRLLFKDIDEVIDIISKDICEHYQENKKGLMVWGNISAYQLHLFGKMYLFDTDGVVHVDAQELYENHADIVLKNKKIKLHCGGSRLC